MPQSKQKDEHGYTPDNYQPLPNKEAIIHFNGKSLLTSKSHLDVKAYEHTLAFTVAGIMDEDLLKDVRDAVASAMENGTDFRTFKRTLKPYLMAKGWLSETLDGTQQLVVGSNRRLRTIYSTNLQTAYGAGQWERIQQTKEFLPYLQYMPSVSENPRLSHKRYYHLVRPVDDVIWQSIMPPNGWGCKCWVKQLTKRQAEAVGMSEPIELETEEYTNPKTGQTSDVPVGIDPSFNHNFDRLTALFKLANDKHGSAFGERLRESVDELTLDLILQPDFTRDIQTVIGAEFAHRFYALKKTVEEANGNRDNSMALRKAHAQGDVWAVATISPSIQELLSSQTAIIWLSDDTLIKMLAHHPELDLLPLFQDTHLILKNALKVIKRDDLNIIYFSVKEVNYIATVKATKDGAELYLTTIYQVRDKEFKKMLNKHE